MPGTAQAGLAADVLDVTDREGSTGVVAEGVEAVHLAVVVDERDVSPAEVDVDPVAVVLEGGEVRNPNEGSLAVRSDCVRRLSQQ